MEDIGQTLKELRIKKGLSIEDIQEMTKIRSRYIQAIEDGNLDKLPGQFYAKAFIKSYAEVLELDPAILKEYQESLPKPDLENIPIRSNYILESKTSKLGNWLRVSLVYVLITMIIVFVYIFYVKYSNDQDEDLRGDIITNPNIEIDSVSPSIPNESNSETNVEQSDEKEPTEELVQIKKLKTSYYGKYLLDEYEVSYAPGTKVQLQLRATDACWYSIRESGPDGKELLTGTLYSGQETELISFDKPLWIHLGNAAGVDIFLNEQKIEVGNEQNPKYILLNVKNQDF
ncbi:hypothetical protein BHF71_00760 [Vulcanibacillus modesticaldus]|uniref:HTH cro/C1-type domain-containing protein n=1 Tax=Vulcanibacillus modesticaldus TaxID=337097 RepID=A0A1D2YXQ9_9BACI|nr:RodZ domain-containing protein [Vulcanibacillus modesticaldus]OEG00469.1 hypothetical protein BHF71_00760 [Vulcanibacillus modesticaldus]